jgi:hypothetical protein
VAVFIITEFQSLTLSCLAYHAIATDVVIAAITPQVGGGVQVGDVVSADLSFRRERIKHASRMIKLCGILRWLQQEIGEGKDTHMFLQNRWAHFLHCSRVC